MYWRPPHRVPGALGDAVPRRFWWAVSRTTSEAVDELRTPRLRLRQWRDADLDPFAALNADPEVMRFLGPTLRRKESDALAGRYWAELAEHGYGRWAVEVVDGAPFAGWVGLSEPSFSAHFTPVIQVGWRLARPHWGLGYATEAARAALAFGFASLGLEEIVSLTAATNGPSRRVMERLGMTRDPEDDFDNPNYAPGDPLGPHVLYRRRRPTPPGRARAATARTPRPWSWMPRAPASI
jgi:ribosomal-protein-alanine N-acetyltransferase